MKRLLSCAESQDLDASTRKLFGLDPLLLMEKASLRLWDRLSLYIDNSAELRAKGKNLSILALCGKGDNGGDALAMLRHARSAGFGNLKAIVSSQPLSPSAQAQRGFLLSAGIPCPEWGSLGEEEKACLYAEADIVLDGILGSGVRGAARGEALKMLEFMGTAEGSERAAPEGENQPLVVSIDLPSGLGDSWTKDLPAIKADLCLCLEPIKEICLSPSARTRCGRILSVGDVFPRDLIAEAGSSFLLEEDDLESLLEPISPESYKMSRGRVAIFAGSLGAAGAAFSAPRRP
jgi:NAD(P)H-hydrate epimerase